MTTEICSERVLYEKKGQVAYITLNRPNVLNAMDLKMHEELKAIWDDFEADDNIRLGVVSGAGDRAFSVGQDLNELAARQSEDMTLQSSMGSFDKPGWPRLTERFDRVKPLIAKVRGYAFGGGFELALACDIIVAASDASFALPEVKLGLLAGAGGIFRLTRQIPFRTAIGYLITGRTLSAETALRLGLVNDVVPVQSLDNCIEDWIQDILTAAPLSIQTVLEVAAKSTTQSLEQAFSLEYECEKIRKASFDAREGPQAFVEKRAPQWRGA